MRPKKRSLQLAFGATKVGVAADAEVAGVATGPGATADKIPFITPVGSSSGNLKDGNLMDGNLKSASWRAATRSKSVKFFSYNEAEEELTRNGSSIDGGRQSED
jgi:hypothetical protein